MAYYDLEKCINGNCEGCYREHNASCGIIIDGLKKYKYISMCRDFDLLYNHYSEAQLQNFDDAIAEYEENPTEANFEDLATYGYSDIINWYEGGISTADLFEFVEAEKED